MLTGAWQFSLKDMTNCGLQKSKLCRMAISLQTSSPVGHFIITYTYFVFPGLFFEVFVNRFVVFCRFAREKRLRLWKDYVPSAPIVPIQNKEFTGKVSEDGYAEYFKSLVSFPRVNWISVLVGISVVHIN